MLEKDDDLCIIIDDNTRPTSKINIKSDIIKMSFWATAIHWSLTALFIFFVCQ